MDTVFFGSNQFHQKSLALPAIIALLSTVAFVIFLFGFENIKFLCAFVMLACNLVLIVLIHSNISKLEKTKKDEAKYETLLNSIGEGVVVINPKGTIELINKEAESLLGQKMSEVAGKKWHDIAVLEDEKGTRIPDEKRSTWITLRTGGIRYNNKYYYVRKGGKKFAVGTTTAPVVFGGKIIGVIGVFRNITHEREVDRSKNEFVSLASHQLRTPLSVVKWHAEMLLAGDTGKLAKETEEFVRNIFLSNERMIELVNSLLNISRIESGRIIIDPEPTDLGKLVDEVVERLKIQYGKKKINLSISIFPDLKEINIDPNLISQVYQNLLTNAYKYTPDGGRIMIIISKKDEDIVSQITDTGYGIPASEQHRVFEKFYRGTNVAKMETDGTGLGLYLVKAIVESSKGRIWFKSKEEKGTSFWFTIPAKGVEPKKGEVTLS